MLEKENVFSVSSYGMNIKSQVMVKDVNNTMAECSLSISQIMEKP